MTAGIIDRRSAIPPTQAHSRPPSPPTGKFSMTGGGPNCDFFKFTSDIAAPPPAAKKQR